MNSEIAATARTAEQSAKVTTTKNRAGMLAGSLLLLSALLALGVFWAALAAPTESQAEPPANDMLLVRLAPHTDRNKAKADLLKEAQATVIRDMHVDRDDYSIFIVQPPKGQREATLKKIEAMMKHHPEIQSVTRNGVATSPLPKSPKGKSGGSVH